MKRPAVIVLGGAALLLVVVLRGLLDPSTDRLPGIDSGNLYTWEIYTREVLGTGRLPFWNPYHFAGTPHLADPQTTVLYPPALFLRWLPAPAFLGWMLALHLWIAAAGTLFAARVIGLGWLAGAAAAIAVMLGGSVPGWIHNGHLLVLYSAAWAPWAFALAIVSVRSGRVLPDGRLVAVLVLQFLTGYLQGSLYLALALGLYFAFSAIWPASAEDTAGEPGTANATAGGPSAAPRWRPLAQLGLLAVLCAAATAFQLLPTATLVSEAGRSAGLPYAEALDGSWTISDLATLFFPFHQVPDTPPHRYLPDRLVYVGWLLTAFVPFAFVARDRRRIAVFFGLVSLLAIALALGDALPLFRLQHAMFPGLRVPGRVLFLATVSLALLGAIGLEAFLMLAAGRHWRSLAVGTGYSVAAVTLATFGALHPVTSQSLPAPGWPWAPIGAAALVLVVAAAAIRGRGRAALVTALGAVVLDLTTLNAGAVATTPLESAATIRQAIGPPTRGRAVSLCENRISAREFLLNREPTLDGPPGLHLLGYGEWASIVKSGDLPPGDGMYRRIGSEGAAPARRDLLDLANVTRIIACAEESATGYRALDVRPNPHAWPRAIWTCAAEEMTRPQLVARLLHGRYAPNGELKPRHYIKVRWPLGMNDTRRAEVARRHQLEEGVALEEETWRYVLGDASVEAVIAIIQDPEIDDTHGVDRGTGAMVPLAEFSAAVPPLPGDDRNRQMLVGTAPCPMPGQVTTDVMDRADGYVSVRVSAPVDGFVFLSEPYYPERQAWVDGRPVNAARADLAFTLVAVPAGDHVVELRYTPSSFYLGSAISGLTGVGYAGVAFARRRRRTR